MTKKNVEELNDAELLQLYNEVLNVIKFLEKEVQGEE